MVKLLVSLVWTISTTLVSYSYYSTITSVIIELYSMNIILPSLNINPTKGKLIN